MKFKELIKEMQREMPGLTQWQIREFVEMFCGLIVAGIEDAPVIVPGFGRFSLKQRKARKGTNPQTGKAIKIPARKVVRFIACPQVRKQVQ
jgi:DNA-binding protein HU-beta